LLPVLFALFAFVALAYTPTQTGTPLDQLTPSSAAACGFATFNAKLDDAHGTNDTNYAATGAVNGYAGARVRVFITQASASGGGQWCNTYKYNALSENSTSATQWTYMGSDAGDTTGACDYIANSRTSHRGYFFRGTGANCAGGTTYANTYDPPSYGEGNNGGWIRNLSCTTYAAPYSAWSTTGSAQKPHAGCQGTTVGFEPNAMASGIFIDTVAPTAPTWTESSATSHKSGNTLYFRKVAATISITLTHTETATSTKSGSDSFSWGTPSVTTGWSGYFVGDVASTTTSTKTITSSTSSANMTWQTDSNDRSDNDGTNLTITFTADATTPTLTWTAPSANDQQAASSFNFTWTNADTGSGVASRTVQKQTAPVSAGNCGTFTNSGTAASNATTAFNYTGMVTNTCYRIVVATTDNVGNAASSTSPSILVDTNAPTAILSGPGANPDAWRDGSTIYYRGGVAGSMDLTVTGSDAVSGFQDQRFNAMGGTTTGWTPTAATAYTTTNPYTVNYAWGSTSTGSATINATVRNNAGLTANATTVSLTRDSTAPALGFNYPAGPTIYTSDLTFTVDFNVTESGSGLERFSAGWSLQRQRAVVSENSCGSYSNDGSPVTGQTEGLDQVSEQTDLESGYCYKWELSATDNVGNTTSFSTATTVIVDETGPAEPVLSTTSTGAYVSDGTVFVNSSAGGTLALTATSADPETGITTINFGAVTTAGGWSPITSANVAATAGAATKTYTWTTGASAADLTVSASSGAGITSSDLNVTFTPDNDNPTVSLIGRYQGQLLTANPVNYWRLGETSDTTAIDIGSAAADGTYTNGVTLGASGLLLNDPDKAATFDGVNDWVSVPAVPAISGSITLSAWASTSDNKNEYVLARGSQAYIRRVTSLNRFVFSWLDSGAVQRTLNSAVDAAPADGLPHFVVATHDGSTVNIYVDGVLSNSLSGQSLQAVPSGTWGIGSNNTGSADLWHGQIDDVAIFDQALNASTIKTLYAFGSSSIQASASYDVAWTGADEQSGILSYSVQRQRGPAVTAGSCTGVTYTNDGSATVTGNEVLSGAGLSDGYCYRWTIIATDYVGHSSSTATTSPILIDASAPVAAGAPSTSPTGFTSSTSVTITAGTSASDPHSGVTSQAFYRQTAAMTNGVCGSYGTEILVTSPNAVVSGNCYTYFTRATNGAGDTTDSASSAAVKVDTSGPVAAGAPSTSPTGFTGSTSVTISAGTAASDPQSGVTETFYRQAATLSGSSCGSYGSPVLVTSPDTVDGGNCYIYFTRATNGTGATADSTSSAAVKVDTTAPAITWNTPSAAAYNTSGTITPVWTVTDAGTGVADAGIVTRQYTSLADDSCGGSWTDDAVQTNDNATSLTTARCYRWSFTTAPTDNAGNETASNLTSDIIKVDMTAPTAAGAPTTSPTGLTNSTSVTITAGASAGDAQTGVTETFYRQTATLTDGECGSYGSPVLVTSPNTVAGDNCYTYFTRATNGAGESSDSDSSAVVEVDTTAPAASEPTLTAASDSGMADDDGITNDATPTFVGTAEPGITVTLHLTGNNPSNSTTDSDVADSNGDWSITVDELEDDQYQVWVTAVDLADNTTTSDEITVIIDTTPPTAPGQPTLDAGSDNGMADDDGLTNDTTPTFTGAGQNGTIVHLYEASTSLGSDVAADDSWSITSSSLSDGSHSIFARASDLAGNESIDSAATAIIIDTVSPTSSLSALNERQSSLLFPVSYNASDADSAIWNVRLYFTSITGTAIGDYTQFGPGFTSSPMDFTAPADGRYYLYSRAVDAAGNIESNPATYDTTTFVRSRDRSASTVIWTFSDNDTHWDVGPTIEEDTTAPSGDDSVLSLASGNSESEAMLVTPGSSLTVSGSWSLDGYGATLELCYIGGACTIEAEIGDIDVSTVQTIGWTDYAFSVTVDDAASEAYLKLTVAGGEVLIDTVAWETEATSEARIFVEGSISVSAPALIDLGEGIPGDLAEEIYDITVISNSSAYTLDLAASDLVTVEADDIPATSLQFREGAGSFVSPIAADERLTLVDSQTPSAPEGTTHEVTTRLLLPFTAAGLYEGTLTFYIEVN